VPSQLLNNLRRVRTPTANLPSTSDNGIRTQFQTHCWTHCHYHLLLLYLILRAWQILRREYCGRSCWCETLRNRTLSGYVGGWTVDRLCCNRSCCNFRRGRREEGSCGCGGACAYHNAAGVSLSEKIERGVRYRSERRWRRKKHR